MSELNSFSELLIEIKNKKGITTFEDLKYHLSNSILLHYQFDLPKEFDLVDIPKLPYNYRFMRNFHKNLSFLKSMTYLKNELAEYFKVETDKHAKKVFKQNYKTKQHEVNFKQVFFNIDTELGSKVIVDDISSYNLEKASLESLKDVITNIDITIDTFKELREKEISNKENFSSDFVPSQRKLKSETEGSKTIDFPEISNLMKNFSLDEVKPKTISTQTNVPESKDVLLDETFKLLGLGSIKQNLGKKIITNKKKEGLFFDEWVTENLTLVQFLLKSLLHLDYLSLKDETHYLSIVRNYKFSEQFHAELKKLFHLLRIENT